MCRQLPLPDQHSMTDPSNLILPFSSHFLFSSSEALVAVAVADHAFTLELVRVGSELVSSFVVDTVLRNDQTQLIQLSILLEVLIESDRIAFGAVLNKFALYSRMQEGTENERVRCA